MGRSITKATLAGAVALLAATSAFAQSKTLTVAAYGGSWEQTLRKEMIPAFEQKHGVKVEYVAASSAAAPASMAVEIERPMSPPPAAPCCRSRHGFGPSSLRQIRLFRRFHNKML